MDKLAMQGNAKELGNNAQDSAEISLNYSMDMIYALGFVNKEEAESVLQEILKKYPNQIKGKVSENKIEYDWAKNYAPKYSITITMKSDEELGQANIKESKKGFSIENAMAKMDSIIGEDTSDKVSDILNSLTESEKEALLNTLKKKA